VESPWLWAADIGNSWRTDGDIQDNWDSLLRCTDNVVGLSMYGGSQHFNDPDILQVGLGGMNLLEYGAQFALWAVLKAPLVIGIDVTQPLSPVYQGILLNKDIIAVNQDSMGVSGDLIWKRGPDEVYAAPLADGSRAVVLFNRHAYTQVLMNITVDFMWLGYPPDTIANVKDLYLGVSGKFTGSYTGAVPTHGVQMLRITPLQFDPSYLKWRPWHEGQAARQHRARGSGPQVRAK